MSENQIEASLQDQSPENEAAGKGTRPPATGKWWELFKPRKGFFVTPLLLIINILLFIAAVADGVNAFSPSVEKLIEWGANVKYLTSGEHEWWRLFTCMFLHIGIIHLALNMYALLSIGLYIETFLGSVRFATCYIVTGLLASLTSLWWHDNVASAGASGAIFGMYGVFLALLTTNMIDKSTRNVLLKSIVVFVVYNLAFGLAIGVDNAAHIGGLVGGIVMGYVLYLMTSSRAVKNNLVQAGILLAIGIMVTSLVLPRVTDPYTQYSKSLEDFQKYETEALEFYELPANTTDAQVIVFIRDKAMPNWQKCKTELAKLDNLDLPGDLEWRRKELHYYVDLRLQLSQKMVDKLGKNTNKYDAEIKELNGKIEAVIERLNKTSQ
jgi:rhomboid protease GluP